MKEVRKVHVSPNRPNLCISVVKCKREDMFNHLEWLVDVIMKKGTKTPKTIIFCNGTLTDIGAVFNYLLLRLGGAAYSPDDSQASDQCLIGIYHSLTLKKYKERVVESFKNDGKKRVVIASSALSMGVNFPDVRYIIHWGLAQNLLDYHQESGRGGRDGKPTHILSIYHGQQLAFCEEDVKTFLKTDGCFRVEAYKPDSLTVRLRQVYQHMIVMVIVLKIASVLEVDAQLKDQSLDQNLWFICHNPH
ncbi:ATP-dependent DNA helicase hus2/rqh1-like [Acropora millepora]|uniref:ATP-dependent DNA helicase hus2/rqh1-like n=1 Tax=Acropora millepora TaxID=45264 RepID=UPI001CF12683|nr:ATP-dependent DNA helicase hus2/rqh1-like [Acropora millepora]